MEKKLSDMIIDTHTKVAVLETVIKGNGVDGLEDHIKENTKHIDYVRKNMVTQDQCACARTENEEEFKRIVKQAISEKGRSRWLILKDILVLIAGPGSIGVLLLLHFLGRLGGGG